MALPQPAATPTATTIRHGNTAGNLNHFGYVAASNGWTYYCTPYLWKISADETQTMRLTTDACKYLNVVDEWVYYQNACDEDKIYKIRTDGTQRTKVSEKSVDSLLVVNDWIYFCNRFSRGNLCKIRTDGTHGKRLSQRTSSCINVIGDWVYYIACYDNRHIYKIRTDGSCDTKVKDCCCKSLTVLGDWIYFDTYDTLCRIRTDGTQHTILLHGDSFYGLNVCGNRLYFACRLEVNWARDLWLCKMNLDGSAFTKISKANTIAVNIANHYIYYLNGADRFALYKIRPDGTQNTKVGNEHWDSVCTSDGWVYFSNYTDNFALYRIRPDGTQREKILDEPCKIIAVSGNWIYHVYPESQYYSLYKTLIDGSGETAIVLQNVSSVERTDNFLLCNVFWKNKKDIRVKIRL